MNKLKRKFIKSQLKKRKVISGKGDYGHALIIAGQKGYMGSAIIAAKAAMRSGVGLVSINVPAEERLALQSTVAEAMIINREDTSYNPDKFSAVCITQGLGTDKVSEELLVQALTKFNKPLLLDTDALSIISNNKELLEKIPSGTIITPQAIEFDRLFGIHQNNDDRISSAIKKAKEHHIIIILKGHETTLISDEKIVYKTTGNTGLSKGGSGEALSGLITSFLAQGYAPISAASIGVYLYGLAADLTLKSQSTESMMITDIIGYFGKAFKKIRA